MNSNSEQVKNIQNRGYYRHSYSNLTVGHLSLQEVLLSFVCIFFSFFFFIFSPDFLSPPESSRIQLRIHESSSPSYEVIFFLIPCLALPVCLPFTAPYFSFYTCIWCFCFLICIFFVFIVFSQPKLTIEVNRCTTMNTHFPTFSLSRRF